MKKALSCVIGFALVLCVAGGASATVIVGNAVYSAAVMDAADGSAFGSWCASTGAAHAVGAGKNLIYKNLSPGTSFSSLRCYYPGMSTTYTYGGAAGGINMDPYVMGEGPSPLAPAGEGWRTTWLIPNESLQIIQDVLIVPPAGGANTGNSAIYHTILLTHMGNPGNMPMRVGWRNLYDWSVNDPGFDDGPNNQLELKNGTVVVPATTIEFSHSPVTADIARISVDPGVPTYQPLLGLAYDPGFRLDLPTTVPDEYDYVSWSSSFWGTAFDYTPTGQDVTGDSAGLIWWGRDDARAIEIWPYASVRLTDVIFGVVADQPPPGQIPEPMTLTLCAMGLGALVLRRRKRS